MDFDCKASGAYARTSRQAIDNAKKSWQILGGLGWSINAFCGLWGNVGHESGYNPWRWQGDKIGASGGNPWTNKGYGFTQFTPASKYIVDKVNGGWPGKQNGFGPNFSNRRGSLSDGHVQLLFVHYYADYIKTGKYPLSYAEYKKSKESPEYLGGAWLYNYERPGEIEKKLPARQKEARYWFNLLGPDAPVEPGEPWEPVEPDPIEPVRPINPPMPIWLMSFWALMAFKRRREMSGNVNELLLGTDEFVQ